MSTAVAIVAPDIPGAESLSVYRLLAAQAARAPQAIAIAGRGRIPLTYGGLLAQIEYIATSLRAAGLARNDRVAVVLPNGPEMALAFFGVVAGATCAPLNPAYRESELDFYLRDLNAKALVVQSGADTPAIDVAQRLGIRVIEITPNHEAAAGVFELPVEFKPKAQAVDFAEPTDTALVLHTSGTTSRPKIVPLTQQNLCVSARNIGIALALGERDRCLDVMPLFHIHGLMALFSSLAAGGSVFCTYDSDLSEFFECLEESQPSWYTAAPAMHQVVLGQAAGNRYIASEHRLRFVRSASSFLPVHVLGQLEELFDAPVIEAYGMTEGSHQVSSNPLPPGRRKAGSVGFGYGTERAIIDAAGHFLAPPGAGEIVLRGPNVTAGYENNPEANAACFVGDWFRTGDAGYIDGDGYLFLTGRLKEIIDRGGEKISPHEIDAVLLQHPAVALAASFALPHPVLGEEVAAAVVLRAGVSTSEADIRRFAFERLAHTKVPQRVLIVDAIPKGPTGKVQRIGLAKKLGLTDGPSTAAIVPNDAAPMTATQAKLAVIWAQVLGRETIGVHENFFDLGGNSLLAARLAAQVCKEFPVKLGVRALFECGTIAELAAQIERDGDQARRRPAEHDDCRHLLRLRRGNNHKRIFCFPHLLGLQNDYGHFFRLARYMAPEYSFYALQLPGPDGEAQIPERLKDLAAEYAQDIRTLQPDGPHFLLGECSGTAEAYETARQLWAKGESVALLALLDGRGPYVSRSYRTKLMPARLMDAVRGRIVDSKFWRPLKELLMCVAFHLKRSRELRSREAWRYLFGRAHQAARTLPVLFALSAEPPPIMPSISEGEPRVVEQVSRLRYAYRRDWQWPFGGRIAVIVNREWYGVDRTFGWADVAAGGVEVHTVAGSHASYMLENDRTVAEKLKASFEEAEREYLRRHPAAGAAAAAKDPAQ